MNLNISSVEHGIAEEVDIHDDLKSLIKRFESQTTYGPFYWRQNFTSFMIAVDDYVRRSTLYVKIKKNNNKKF
jgi:hypothetical protein